MKWKNIRRYLFKSSNLYVYRMSVTNHIIESRLSVDFSVITYENIYDIVDFRDEKILDSFRDFLVNDEYGLFGYYEGKVIIHGWAIFNTTGQMKRVRNYFDLPPKSALIHNCNVNAKYSSNNVYKFLLTELYSRIDNDFSIYIDTGIDNVAAQKAILASGGVFLYRLKVYYMLNKYFFKSINHE